MSALGPTPRTAMLMALAALSALIIPPALAAILATAVLGAAGADAFAVRAPPATTRRVPRVLARGRAAALEIDVRTPGPGTVAIRQPLPPDVHLDRAHQDGALRATLVATRRGRHVLPAVATRTRGPLGLGRADHRPGEEHEIAVYPDLPAARSLALAVRDGRLRDPGLRTRGPIGLGTDFERVRDYVPGDDIRQVNWRATARLGRPMSNQLRVENDREVLLAIDCGRLMAAPTGGAAPGTLLDAALDAVAAVALVADELGDRCGALAFDDTIRRHIRPRRAGGAAVVRATFDLEPSSREPDHALAFRTLGAGKRALVIVLTDLLEESAARPLVAAVPFLARRHAVIVAGASDPGLDELVRGANHNAFAAVVARDVIAARRRAAALVRRAGADVIEAQPTALGAACVAAYLRAKRQTRW